MSELKRATIKSKTEDKIVVGGYAAIWGSPTDRDLENEYFTKETDFWTDKIPGQRPVLYEHGGHPVVKSAVLGYTLKFMSDDIGLSVEAELDRHNKYIDTVVKLAEAGVLGWSSGAIAHLIGVGKDGQIKSWPIAEMTLTVEPAEPRLLDLPLAKSLLDGAGAEFLDSLLKDIAAAEVEDLTLEAGSTESEEQGASDDNKYIIAATAAAVTAAEENENG